MTTRKPVDKLNGYDSREAMWAEIRTMKSFTIPELKAAVRLHSETVREYVIGLLNGGYLNVDHMSNRVSTYFLVRDVGVDAPRVRKNGSAVTQGQGTANMWRTMRILSVFTAKDLAIAASTETCQIKESTAATYLFYLRAAGYLQLYQGKVYRFVATRYTGPKPPMIQRVKRVFDPNLKRVMWSEGDAKANQAVAYQTGKPQPLPPPTQPPPTPSLTEGGGLVGDTKN